MSLPEISLEQRDKSKRTCIVHLQKSPQDTMLGSEKAQDPERVPVKLLPVNLCNALPVKIREERVIALKIPDLMQLPCQVVAF